jgi:hypothetical protein
MKAMIKSFIISFLLLSSTQIFAQNPGDPPLDPGISPINDYIIHMMVLGMAMGFFMFKKKKNSLI